METVLNLNPERRVEEFCDFLYGVETGFVYVPTKDPVSDYWEPNFFEWPAGKKSLVDFVTTSSVHKEVYIGPALYLEPKTGVENVRGANVVWAEFDGKVPNRVALGELPGPSLRVRSSGPGHEHWYWKLENFSMDLKWLQDTNRALAYRLGADYSGWDAGQVLRPAGSLNHKRESVAPVTVVKQNDKENTKSAFSSLPPVEDYYSAEELKLTRIPKADTVLLKYSFTATHRDLITKPSMQEGARSSALTKVAFIASEVGMDNSEMFALIQWVDNKWGKYRDRRDKVHCYLSLVNYVRQSKPYSEIGESTELDTELDLSFPMLGMLSHVNQVDDVKWIIPGVLHDTSVVYFVGESASYKTMLVTELGVNLAMGLDMLDWKITTEEGASKKFRIGMFSLEMSGPELNTRYRTILNRYTPEVQATIADVNFLTYSDSLKLYDPADVVRLRDTIIKYKLDGIIIDSAQMCYSPNMSDESFVKKSTENLQRLRHELNFFAMVVHHPRKDQQGGPTGAKRKYTLSDLFGSQILQNSASTVIQMTKLNDKTETENAKILLNYLKMRFNDEHRPSDMTIELLPDLTFKRAVSGEIENPKVQLDAINKEADNLLMKARGNGPNANLDI